MCSVKYYYSRDANGLDYNQVYTHLLSLLLYSIPPQFVYTYNFACD